MDEIAEKLLEIEGDMARLRIFLGNETMEYDEFKRHLEELHHEWKETKFQTGGEKTRIERILEEFDEEIYTINDDL